MAKITKQGAVKMLENLAKSSDTESAHAQADEILLILINSKAVRVAYEKVEKWYA